MRLGSTLPARDSAFDEDLSLRVEDEALAFAPMEKAKSLAPGGEFAARSSAAMFHPVCSWLCVVLLYFSA
jgi:hypothetical protein